MIILRRLGSQETSCEVILSDPLQGIADGINQTFTVSNEYVPGRIEILYNGQVLTSTIDFEETGPDEITFIYLKPTNISVLSANYEIGDCSATGGGSYSSSFLELEDTPSSYTSQAGKIVSVNETETGLSFIDFAAGTTNFISLTDTPTTYSGFENYYIKVNSIGTGLEFVLPEGDVQEGIFNIPNGASTAAVTFDRQFASGDYVLTVGLENNSDLEPSVFPILIWDKTEFGFRVDFSGEMDSENYYLNWRATLSGAGVLANPLYPTAALGSSEGLTELSNDLSPELGGDLEVGCNLLMLDPHPNCSTVSGGYIRGYSGEASEMFVANNNPSAGDGFGTPLYMISNGPNAGKWGTCTAVSGTTQMPCAAMAIESGDGEIKKILWKGIVRKGEWGTMPLTPGKPVYVSTIEGAISTAKPNNGHWKQCIGIAIASDTIRFDPGFNPGYY